DRGHLLDRGEDQAARPLAARQHRFAADGVPGHRARSRDHDPVPVPADRGLRHDLDPAHRLRHALHALRAALQHDLHAPDPQGAGGISGDERRLVGHLVSPNHPAAAQARAARRLDLHRHRLDPRAVQLHPALQPGHRGALDPHLGAVGERPVRRALGARGDVHPGAVRAGAARPARRQALWNKGSLMLNVTGLCTEYMDENGKAIRAAQDISFEVPAGKLFTLLGPSGCGKTTTLRSIAGLEKPRAGEISVGGTLIYSSRQNVFIPPNRRGLGMVFQSYAIWPHMTVFENAAFPLQVGKQRSSKKQIQDRVARVLKVVALEDMAEREATKLSGGQQQRLALARALVMEPPLLLLDEPLSNLDAKLRERMRFELKRLQRDLGITTVYVTHDQSEALALSHSIAVMNRGQIQQ